MYLKVLALIKTTHDPQITCVSMRWNLGDPKLHVENHYLCRIQGSLAFPDFFDLNLWHAVSVYVLIFFSLFVNVPSLFSRTFFFLPLQDVSELRNELQRKETLVQKHLAKLHHWQQVLEDVSAQHRKPSDLPPPGPLAFLEQASASLPPAPLKPN